MENGRCSLQKDGTRRYQNMNEGIEMDQDASREVCLAIHNKRNGARIAMDTQSKDKDTIEPDHYKDATGKDLFDYFNEGLLNHPEDFYVGNIMKYIRRYKEKNGLEDLEKAKRYTEELIKVTKLQAKGGR